MTYRTSAADKTADRQLAHRSGLSTAVGKYPALRSLQTATVTFSRRLANLSTTN